MSDMVHINICHDQYVCQFSLKRKTIYIFVRVCFFYHRVRYFKLSLISRNIIMRAIQTHIIIHNLVFCGYQI